MINKNPRPTGLGRLHNVTRADRQDNRVYRDNNRNKRTDNDYLAHYHPSNKCGTRADPGLAQSGTRENEERHSGLVQCSAR